MSQTASAPAAASSSAAKASRSGSTTTEENYKLRVFVGNLPWSIDQEALTKLFSDAGRITEVNVASFRTRSLGFGFVQFSTEQEAARAVQMFQDKNIDGRQLNVEHAKSPNQISEDRAAKGAQREARPRRSRGGRRGQGGEEGAAGTSSSTSQGGAAKAEGGEGAPKRRRRPRGKKPAGENGEKVQTQQSSSSNSSNNSGSNNNAEGGEAKRPRRRRSRKTEGGEEGEARAPANTGPKEESDTTVFVANLPFDCDDNQLASLFGGLSLNKAYVVVKRNGRSKGFGFAEFKDKTTQASAINKVNGSELNGRPLSVRAAYKQDESKATSSSAQ